MTTTTTAGLRCGRTVSKLAQGQMDQLVSYGGLPWKCGFDLICLIFLLTPYRPPTHTHTNIHQVHSVSTLQCTRADSPKLIFQVFLVQAHMSICICTYKKRSTCYVCSICHLFLLSLCSRPTGGPLWSSLPQIPSTVTSMSSIFHLRYAKMADQTSLTCNAPWHHPII